MTAPSANISKMLLSDNEYFNSPPNAQAGYVSAAPEQFTNKLNQVCGLLLQLTEEQRETNLLLRKLINEDNPGHYKLVKLSNQEKYVRFLIVLENDRSKPRLLCPICQEDVEITTAKRGGCKQQSFCGDYVVCNECTNDALQKVMRCPQCCETYSNIPVPLCSHLLAVTGSEGHLARKGSGNGCPVCNGKLVKEKCPQNCSRKELANYNMAKTILSERVFVLVKNPEACTDDEDRPCSHYCRCTKHNILFTNRNKGAKCRECTKESTKERHLGKRKRKQEPPTPQACALSIPVPRDSKRFVHTGHSPYVDIPAVQPPPQQLQQYIQLQQQQQLQQQLQQQQLQQFQFLQQQQQQQQQQQPQQKPFFPPELMAPEDLEPYGDAVPSNTWLPNFNVRELGKKVNLDDLLKMYPVDGVVEFGKRVTNNLTNTLGFSVPSDTRQQQNRQMNHQQNIHNSTDSPQQSPQ